MSDKLTINQEVAVEYIDNPLLIVAGPGSGKTRVLVEKIDYLLTNKKVDPSKIFISTFTVKASEEIRQRIINNNKDNLNINNMFIGTLHSFCENIIKEYGSDKYYVDFDILDDFKRYLFVKKNLSKLQEFKKLTEVFKGYNVDVFYELNKFYDKITENLIDVEKLKEEFNDNIIKNDSYSDEDIKKLVESYKTYVDLLYKHKYLDFPLLEKYTFNLLSNESVLNKIKERYQYFLIDEFQDISPLQWKIISKIKSNHITLVGDPNQAIYGFRGANPNIFEKVNDEFKKENIILKKIELDINFRSKKDIVEISNIFLKNINRDNKVPLIKENRKERCKIYNINYESEIETCEQILNLILDLKKQNKIKEFGDVALLFRSVKKPAKIFINLLDNNPKYKQIKYEVSGNLPFFEKEEIRLLIFLFGYIYNFSEEDFLEIKEFTKFNYFSDIFKTILLKVDLSEDLNQEVINWNFTEISAVFLKQKGIPEDIILKIINLNKLKKMIVSKPEYSIQYAFYDLLKILNFNDIESKYPYILNSYSKFSNLLQKYSDIYTKPNILNLIKILKKLPENIKIENDNSFLDLIDNTTLKIMTVHQAKGLEFPVVIIPSLITKRFPLNLNSKSCFSHYILKEYLLYEDYSLEKEEENLFYVAITRAKDYLFLSYFNKAEELKKKSSISKFIKPLLTELDSFSKVSEIDPISYNKIDNYNILHLSYSTLSTFVDCQTRFKINYMYGFKAEETYMQKVGQIYHNSIANINYLLLDNNKNFNSVIDTIPSIVEKSWIDLGEKDNIKFKKEIINNTGL